MDILILNGPNLNLIGTREPEIYGHQTMEEVIGEIRDAFPNLCIHHFQTNHEGDIIDKLQEVGFTYNGIILNAGGYTHTSIAIADAVKAITTPVVEVHISDIENREDFRKHSYISANAVHKVIGKGVGGYHEAVAYFLDHSQ